ncbi:MAG: helix-turn-helix domain-containing protein, partial [Plesiomonas sp.]
YSHFRRLCRHALGSAAKAELRDWRMARSLLDVVEGQENLTQVAIKHGYASSSHFSNEIRELLGVSPRGLSNIIQLASK